MKLQDRLLKISAKPQMFWIVMGLTVCESVFLFVPTEVFMTPPIVAKKKNAPATVLAASIGSLIGGAMSYIIGLYLFDSIGLWLIGAVSSLDTFAKAQMIFEKYGLLVVFITAFTPVPYKVMSITAGFLGYNPILYLGFSAIFRTGRFAIAGYLLWRFQEQANMAVKKYFWPLTLAAIAAAFLGLALLA
ncbi:MAG: VTT domain-containing protein [Rickettsiales bacterium]|jgi:membrane protein YqaA with SNARE-associated domain|nr:VTT domain-containing protein [Rickettsiales bacterium]